jgi:hypothetical protein
MEPWTGAQSDIVVNVFCKKDDSLGSLSVNFEESSGLIAIVMFHQLMPSRPGFETSRLLVLH